MPLDHLKRKNPKPPQLPKIKIEEPPKITPPEPHKEAQLKFACDHTVPISKVVAGPCGGCREATYQKSRRPKRKKLIVLPMPDRLPAGSRKELTWDGKKWKGLLFIPDITEPFWYEAGTESKCFHGLHQTYVDFMQLEVKPENPTV